MSIKLVTLTAFNNVISKLTGHPFYVLEDKIEQPTTENLTSYIENNFNSLFNYGINIRRIGTLDGSGPALVIADKHTDNGVYGAYAYFGYGNSLTVRRCVNGKWYDGKN